MWKNSAISKRVLQLLRQLLIIFRSAGRGLKANTRTISIKCVQMGHLLRSTPRYQKTFTPDKMGLHDLHLACVWLAGIFDQFHRQGGRVDSNVYNCCARRMWRKRKLYDLFSYSLINNKSQNITSASTRLELRAGGAMRIADSVQLGPLVRMAEAYM